MSEQSLTHRDLTDFILKNIRILENATTVHPNSRARIDRIVEVKLSKDGGIYSYFENQPYPAKGFPYYDTVHRIDAIKKVFLGLLYGFHTFHGKTLLALFFLIFRTRITQSLHKLTEGMWVTLKPHRLKPLYYCNAVKELYQAFDEKDEMIRDLICMTLEFDDAYRFRFQYALGELDKEKFAKNQYKELDRVAGLLEAREKEKKLIGYWKLLRKFLFFGFFFKKFRIGIVKVLARVDPARIKMDEGDEYYAKTRHNF